MRFVGWLLYRLSQLTITLLGALMWRMKIEGRSNIPKTGSFLLCPVHRSNADGPIASVFLWRRMGYLSKAEMFQVQWMGKVFIAMGAIPVNRGNPDRASLRKCLDALAAGKPLVLFPEGGRKSGDTLAPLMDGAAYLALKAGVPIVPVGIDGSDEAQPRGKKAIRRSQISIVIGKPIALQPGPRQAASRQAVVNGMEVLATELQERFREAQEMNARRRGDKPR